MNAQKKIWYKVLLSVSLSLLFFSKNVSALGCTPSIISDAVVCTGSLVPSTSFMCGGNEGGTQTISNLISSGVLLSAPSALTTPQYVVLFGRIDVDIDYHFAPNSIIILAKSQISPINNEGFLVKNNILFSLDGTLLTSYRENPSIPCSQFFFSISTSTDSKIHFTHSRIDHLNGIIPIGNMEFVFIDGCNFTLNSLFYPLNGANLTLFEVKNNLFHGQNSLGSRVIDIFNYSGVAVIHNNYFEKFEHNVVAQNINLLLYTKNTSTNAQGFKVTDSSIKILSNNYHYGSIITTGSEFINSNVEIADSDLDEKIAYINSTSKFLKCTSSKFRNMTYLNRNTNCDIDIFDCDYYNNNFFSLWITNNISLNTLIYK